MPSSIINKEKEKEKSPQEFNLEEDDTPREF
jgi:hypothetical protein